MRETRRDRAAILTLDQPPARAMVPAHLADVYKKLTAACADASVQAIVLAGAGRGFGLGLDPGAWDDAAMAPSVGDLCHAIENSAKPVVAALRGVANGAAVAVMLAAHGRVARGGGRLALTDIHLGQLPGGGVTQRLPRLIGAPAALELMVSGQAVDVGDARLGPLFDRIADGDPTPAAVELALSMAQSGQWTRTRDRTPGLTDPAADQNSIAEMGGALRDKDSAAADIVACVEAAHLLPFEQGLAFENARAQDRAARPEARALHHVYRAERRRPKAQAADAPHITTVALLGSSPLAAELAMLCISRGLTVRALVGGSAEEETLLQRVQTRLDRAHQAGRISQQARDRRLARLSISRGTGDLAAADLILDTGEPQFDAPVHLQDRAVWILVNDTVHAEDRAIETGAEGRMLRMRLHRPGRAGQLLELEVPVGQETLDAGLVQCFSDGVCSVIRCAGGTGYPGDTMAAALHGAALVMLACGMPADQIEDGAQALGFARGPLRMIDEAGAFATLARMRRACDRAGLPLRPLRLLSDRIADAGSNPARALAFHRPAGQALQPAPDLAAWMAEWREDNPLHVLPWPGIAPATALHAALVNEAVRRIGAGAVEHAGDLDLAMVKGYGFARAKGGPLFQADLNGSLGLLRAMAGLQKVAPALWTPQPLVSEMVKNGRRFFQGIS